MDVAAWVTWLAAPVAWALYTGLAWIVPTAACDAGGSDASWHAVSAAALAVALTGLAAGAARVRRLARERSWPGLLREPAGFVMALGALLAALLALGILISWSFGFAIGPCS